MLERSKSCKEKFSSWLATSKSSRSSLSSSSSGSSQLTLERLIVLLSSAMECNCLDWKNVAKQVNDVRRSYSSSFDASNFKILTIQECKDQFNRVYQFYADSFKGATEFKTSRDEQIRRILDDLVFRRLEELVNKSLLTSQDYYDVHIAVDWTLAKNSESLYGLLTWSEFRRAHSDLYNTAKSKSTSTSLSSLISDKSSSATSTSVPTRLPGVERLSMAVKQSGYLFDRAEYAINRIIVNLLIWDSQWPDMHEEIEMIASKLLNKIPVKKYSEPASQTNINQTEIEAEKEVSVSDQLPELKASHQKEESHAESITPVDSKQNSSVPVEAKQNEEEKVEAINCEPKDVAPSASTNFVYKTRRSLRRSLFLGTTSTQSLVEQPIFKDINNNNTVEPINQDVSTVKAACETTTTTIDLVEHAAATTVAAVESIAANSEKEKIIKSTSKRLSFPITPIIQTRRQAARSAPQSVDAAAVAASAPSSNPPTVTPIVDINNNDICETKLQTVVAEPQHKESSQETREQNASAVVSIHTHQTRSRTTLNRSFENPEVATLKNDYVLMPRRLAKRRLSFAGVSTPPTPTPATVKFPQDEDSSPEVILKIRKSKPEIRLSSDASTSKKVVKESVKTLEDNLQEKNIPKSPLKVLNKPVEKIAPKRRLMIRVQKYELILSSQSIVGLSRSKMAKKFRTISARIKRKHPQQKRGVEETTKQPQIAPKIVQQSVLPVQQPTAPIEQTNQVETRRMKRKAECLEASPIVVSIPKQLSSTVKGGGVSVRQEPILQEFRTTAVSSKSRKSSTSKDSITTSSDTHNDQKSQILLRLSEDIVMIKHSHLVKSEIERKPMIRRLIDIGSIRYRIITGEIITMIDFKHAFMKLFTDLIMKTPSRSEENHVASDIFKEGLKLIENKMDSLDEKLVEPASKRSRLS